MVPPKCEIIFSKLSICIFFTIAIVKEDFSQSPLKVRKSDNYRSCDSWNSDNYRKRNKGKKQKNYTKNEAKEIKSNSFKRSNRENIAFWGLR